MHLQPSLFPINLCFPFFGIDPNTGVLELAGELPLAGRHACVFAQRLVKLGIMHPFGGGDQAARHENVRLQLGQFLWAHNGVAVPPHHVDRTVVTHQLPHLLGRLRLLLRERKRTFR